MLKTVTEVKKLNPTEQALIAYLDEMLRVSTESPASAIVEPEPPPPAVVAKAPVAPPVAPVVAPPPAPVIAPPVTAAPAPVMPRPAATPVAPAPAAPPPADNRPVIERLLAEKTVPVNTVAEKTVPVNTVAVKPVLTPPVETSGIKSKPVESTPVIPKPAAPPVRATSVATPPPVTPAVQARVTVPEAKVIVPPTVPVEEASDEGALPPGWAANGRPVWAQSEFDVLIFKVAGLKLAVPLVSLGLIYPIEKKLNTLPNQTDWFLGLLRVHAGNIKVIDTARHVMPERYTPTCSEDLKFVITLHGYEWGLACHEVDKAIRLDPDAISWRTQRGKRPWMAGTVREHMCALIDTAGFHRVIESVEQEA